MSEKWFEYTRDSWRVECRPLRTPMGAIAYLALHHHKREQAPPKGWSGKRFRPSRGYFNRPVGELRAEARALLQDRRIESALMDYFELPEVVPADIVDDLILDNIDWARAEAAKQAPTLVHTRELRIAGVPRDADHMPAKLAEVVLSNVDRSARVDAIEDRMRAGEPDTITALRALAEEG